MTEQEYLESIEKDKLRRAANAKKRKDESKNNASKIREILASHGLKLTILSTDNVTVELENLEGVTIETDDWFIS